MRTRAPKPAPPAWQALINEWAMSLEAENKSPRTIRGYCDAVRFFHIWLADPDVPPEADDPETWLASVPPKPTEPADYEPNHVKRWIAYRLATTSPGNANNNYRALSAWFNWLLTEEEIEHHPMARMNPPHIPDQPIPITPVEFIKQVLRDCQGRDFHSRRDEAIIRLIWDTGGRLSEIANIDLERDLDLSRRVVNVLGKGGKWRALPFSAATGKALGRYLRVRARHPYADTTSRLWLSDHRRSTPLSPNGIKIMLRRRGNAADAHGVLGRNLHAHLGRHFQAHTFLSSGGSEGDLMLLNGWTTAQMARRYGASAAAERAHEAARKIRIGDAL
ncbi:tyrosine-type recombinase/integrase [Amycolatopsis jiangsuensis]|uniref:Site-specific recombinase XerD n=1 Tax=Amycolatopsis jiangsuensis TaxID=1181879 RepID=A0A840J6P4_9PSEU|nr:tyrosine-type recombinase/integrase [Amycolatopsis jiangsuensis]MBB4689700.1 site-specific recombinase XerD [Amycolatopsis jiangsuensis]